MRCSSCPRELEYVGGPLDQYRGNVCISCRLVLCPTCIKVGYASPCPRCAQPTKPALREYLLQIGKV